MKNTKILWRLKEQPTSENLRELVKDGILSKDEAREILFSSETEETRDRKDLESEIKFLRELVEKLSQGQTTRIIETIREVERPWRRYGWYQPYYVWCTNTTGGGTYMTTATAGISTLNLTADSSTSSGITNAVSNTASSFSDIKTF